MNLFLRNATLSIVFSTFFVLFFRSVLYAGTEQKTVSAENKIIIRNIEECLAIALEKNRRKHVSRSVIEIAEAQHKQALSAYWPQVWSSNIFTRLDKDPNFLISPSAINLNMSGMPMPIAIPEKEVKLMDKSLLYNSMSLRYPLFTGGKVSSVSKQAEIGIDAAKEAARRTELQIIYDVKKFYYGAILAKKIRKIAQDTRDRFEATLTLTEGMYKTGTGFVKKTDYLKTKVIFSTIRSMLEMCISNEQLAEAALINSMGLDWNTRIELLEEEIPFEPHSVDLSELVSETFQFSPDWARIDLGLEAAQFKIKEAKSGFFPVLAFTGNLGHMENSYNYGMMTSNNKDSWQIGLALELPIFKGFRTVNEIKEAKKRLEKIRSEKILFREGLVLQVKDAFLQISRAKGQVEATRDALEIATENRELNVRAYQNELVETDDVIGAQILESFVSAQYYKALYDHINNQAKLNYIVGTEVQKKINERTIDK